MKGIYNVLKLAKTDTKSKLKYDSVKKIESICRKFPAYLAENCDTHEINRICITSNYDDNLIIRLSAWDEEGNIDHYDMIFYVDTFKLEIPFTDLVFNVPKENIRLLFVELINNLTDKISAPLYAIDLPCEGNFKEGYIYKSKYSKGEIVIQIFSDIVLGYDSIEESSYY